MPALARIPLAATKAKLTTRNLIHTGHQIITILVACYGLVTFILSAAFFLTDYDSAVIEFAHSGFLLGLWTVPFVLLVALFLKRRVLLVALLLPALITFSTYTLPYYLPKNTLDAEQQITILSYNILARKRDIDEVEAIIRKYQPDVIGLQEFSAEAADYLAQALAEDYPYQALHPQGAKGQGIFSRYPILEDEYWQYQDLPRIPYAGDVRSHGHQRVEIDYNGQPIVIYNTHPWPPLEWKGGFTFIVEPQSDLAHQITIRRVLGRAITETLPTLMIGDFNMSDQFVEYDLITDHFTDTQREAGIGTGYSYPAGDALPPLIRLDYIFHDSQWRGIEARTLYDPGPSDHYPVLARLTLVSSA